MENNSLKVFCDGGARGNPGPAATGFVVYDNLDKIIFEEGKFIGVATNNVAEYKAVIFAFDFLISHFLSVQSIEFFLDSELLVRQLNGIYRVKNKNLVQLFLEVKKMENKFSAKISFQHIKRVFNKEADSLVNKTLDKIKF